MYFNEQSTEGACGMSSVERFITNEELVAMVKRKNDDAFKILLSRFDKFILFKCNCYNTVTAGIDVKDLMQECEIALYKAALDFKPELGFQFTTYFKSVLAITIKREMKKAYLKKERKVISEYTNYDLNMLEQKASDRVEETPEGYVIRKETQNRITDYINNCLSYLEKTCLILYINGLNYEQIAAKLNINKKSVDGALFRARHKLSKYADMDDIIKLIKNK